jgi:hypothetical protein
MIFRVHEFDWSLLCHMQSHGAQDEACKIIAQEFVNNSPGNFTEKTSMLIELYSKVIVDWGEPGLEAIKLALGIV